MTTHIRPTAPTASGRKRAGDFGAGLDGGTALTTSAINGDANPAFRANHSK